MKVAEQPNPSFAGWLLLRRGRIIRHAGKLTEINMVQRVAILCSGMRNYTLLSHLQELSCPDIVPELVTSRLPHTPYSPYDLELLYLGYLDAAVRAEREGFDAVFIDAYPDYGLRAMKSALCIPVVGAGQATMSLATTLGRRFSIVTVWPRSFDFLYRNHLHDCGMTDRCASVRFIGPEDETAKIGTSASVMERMHRGEASITEAVIAECERAVHEDGADTIVFGCTCMTPIGPAVAAACDFPVLECSRVGYQATQSLLKLGVAQSKIAFPPPRPTDLARIGTILDSGHKALPLQGECDVCIVASEA